MQKLVTLPLNTILICVLLVFPASILISDEPSLSNTPSIVDVVLSSATVPFIENQGQTDSAVKFYADTFAGKIYVTDESLTYALHNYVIKEKFGSALAPDGLTPSSTVVNYFKGEQKDWRQNVPTFNGITLGSPYSGISVDLIARHNNVEKIFTVLPYYNPSDISVLVEGADSITISNDGKLQLHTSMGILEMTAPVAYQNIDGMKKDVSVSYVVSGNTYGFELGSYDKRYKLVIDPLLASTFLGASGNNVK